MQIIKHLSLYTIVGFLGAGVNFFLMPYLSHFLTPAEYGILAMINSFVTILIPLVGLVASGLIFVEYYKIKDRREFASLFTTVQLVPVVPTLVLLLITYLFSDKLAAFLEIPESKKYWLYLSIFLASLTIFYETLITYTVIEKKPFQYALYNVLKLVIEVGITLWLVSGLRMGWEGRLLAWLISTMLLSLFSIAYFYRKRLFTTKLSKKYFWMAIMFGLPLILHTIGKFVINQSDRIFITKMVSLEEAGIYNIGYQVGMIMLLLVNAIGNFYQPYLYERLTSFTKEARIQIVKLAYLLIGGLAIALIALTLFAPVFFEIFVNKSYSGATAYVFWVGLSYLLWGVYILFSGFLFYKKQTVFLGVLAVVNVVLNLVLNYLLIQVFGALGAAYATCISFLVVAIIVMWRSMQLYRLPWTKFQLVFRNG